jgi:hypothetical protein
MTETVALSVPATAVRLGRSERTIWRQIRSGELKTRHEGRRVMVLVEGASWAPLGTGGGHRVGEAIAPYGTARDWEVGAFPYTQAVVERHRQARLARRRAAFAEMDRIAKLTRPDPDGLTAVDYIHAERDHPRALEGGDAAGRALEKLARERHRPR